MKMVCSKFQIIFLILFRDALMIDTNGTSSFRKERVNGHMVKLNSEKQNTIHCVKEGLQPDNEDCTIFYRCLKSNNDKYTLFRFQCAPGTVFDTNRGICNYPQKTERSGCKIPSEIKEYDKTIQDFHGEVPKPIFNRDQDIGLYKPLNNYNELSDDYQEPYEQAYPVTPSTVVAHSTEIFTRRPPFLVEKEHDDNRCTTDGFMGDTKDCKKFYRCVNNLRGGYIRYEFTCNDGTIWDDSTQGCNHAWIAQNLKCSKEKYNDFNNLNMEFGNKNNYEDAEKKFDDNLPNYYNHPHIIPTQTTIDYINIESTTLTDKPHNKPTSSSVQMQFGDKISGYSDSISNPITTEVIKDQPNVMKVENTESNPSSDKYQSNTCVGNGFFSYPGDCKKFYRCIESSKGKYVRYDFSCSDGTVWDDHLKTCNFAWVVKECGSLVPLREEKINDVTTTKVYASPSSEYTSSSMPSKDRYTTYAPNNNESSTKDSSTLSDISFSVGVGAYDSYQEECRSNGFYGDKNNCQNFYRCIETRRGVFTKLAYKCGEGTLWDPSIEACNHAWAVKNCTVSESNSQSNAPTISTVYLMQTTTHANEILEKETDNVYNQEPDQFIGTTPRDLNNLTNKTSPMKCTRSGFIGDANNCKKFYRCVDNGSGKFTQYEFTCGENTVWDPIIESCNHAWAVKRCGGVGFFEHSNETVPTTHSDVSTQEANVENSTRTTVPDKLSSISSTKSSDALYTSTTHSDFNENISELCQSEGFYPDHEDCKKFYQCLDSGNGQYIKYDFTCSAGTAWDITINSCNHIQYVKSCQSMTNDVDEENQPYKPAPETETEQKQPFTTTTTPTKIPLTSDQNVQATSSSNKCIEEGYFGNKKDCKKFYRCVDNGKAGFEMYDYSCGDGTIWDQHIKACNHPTDVEHPSCSPESNVSSIEHISEIVSTTPMTYYDSPSSEPITTTKTSYTSSSPRTSTTSSTLQSTGDTICHAEGFFGDVNDCKIFYRCIDNGNDQYIKYEFVCGEGTIWDQDILACNHPQDVKHPSCLDNNGNYSTTTNNDATSTSELTTSKVNPTSTTTVKSTQTSEITEANVMVPSTTGKLPDQSSSDNMKPVDKNKCSEEGYFGNTEDCQKFYRCVDNGKNSFTKYDFTCGEGTIWDQDILACNHPQDVKRPACLDNNGNYSTTTNNDASPTSELPTSKVNPTSTTTVKSAQTSENTETNIMMPSTTGKPSDQSSSSSDNMKPVDKNTCSEEGYFGNTDDCQKFYRCVDNGKNSFTKYDFTCGEGTIWDQDIIACNHPQDVEHPSCSSNTSSVESTTTEKQIDVTSTTTVKPETSSTTNANTQTKTTTDSPTSTSTTHKTPTTTTATSTPSSTSSSSTSTSESTTIENNENQSSTEQQETGNFTCTEAGFYPNPNDCKKFYRCVDWYNNGTSFSIFHFECGEGTIWDPSLDTCNYEDAVYPPRNCSGSSTQNNTESTTSGSSSTDTTTTEASTAMTSSEASTTEQSNTSSSTEQSSSTSTTEQSSSTSTTEQSSSTSTTEQSSPTSTTEQSSPTSTEQSSSTQSSTTTEQQTSTTERSTTQTEASSTEQSTTTTSESTTTERSTTTDKTTEESSTSEATTQSSSTEQQSSSTTDSSTESDKTTTEATQQTTESTTSSTPKDKCPNMEDDQYAYVCPTSFRRHPKYCNIFYQCTEDDDSHDLKIALFHCPNNTIYDETKTQCVAENKASKKCDGTLAQTHRIKRFSNDYIDPIIVGTESYACPNVGYFPFERDQDCSQAMLKCQRSRNNKLSGFVFRCPEGYTFWSKSKRCERLSRIKDCKRSVYPWSKRYDIPKEVHNVALY